MKKGILIDYKATITALLDLAEMELTNAMELIGITVENNAKAYAPVDTGDLRRSITHNILNKNTVEVGTVLDYAVYPEVGTGLYALNGDGRKTPWHYKDAKGTWHTTSGQKPQQYMKKGLDDSVDDIKTIINNEIRRQIDNAGL